MGRYLSVEERIEPKDILQTIQLARLLGLLPPRHDEVSVVVDDLVVEPLSMCEPGE